MSTPTIEEEKALASCGALIKYATETVNDPTKKSTLKASIQTIEQSWAAQTGAAWTPDIGTEFWSAYDALCTIVAPATADTLKIAVTPISDTKRKTRAEQSAQRYLVVFVILLVASVGLSFLTSTVSTINSSIQDITKTTDPIADNIAKQLSLMRAKSIADKAEWPTIDSTEGQSLAATVSALLPVMYSNADKLYAKAASASIILFEPYPVCADENSPKGCYTIGDGAISKTIHDAQSNVDDYRLLSRLSSGRADRALDRSNFIKSTILPLLLGMTGACAWVVRTISEQIKTSSFSSTSPIRHFVRVALGALAGVVIGFGGIVTGGTLSAVALSFLAGYSIDTIFSMLDNISSKLK